MTSRFALYAQGAMTAALAFLAFATWTVRDDGPVSAHAAPSATYVARSVLTPLCPGDTCYTRSMGGATVAYTVPPRMDETPACAAGLYFTPTRVAIGRVIVRGQWNAGDDRLVYNPDENLRDPNPDDETSGLGIFDGLRFWNGTAAFVTLEGRCL